MCASIAGWVTSETVSVCIPTVRFTIVRARIPPDSAMFAGSCAVPSLDVTAIVCVQLTRFQSSSTE